MNGKLVVRPGFPLFWDHASIETPDIDFSYKRNELNDTYIIKQHFQKKLSLVLEVKASHDSIVSININGKKTTWKQIQSASGQPVIQVIIPDSVSGKIEIKWGGDRIEQPVKEQKIKPGENFTYTAKATILKIFDPQQVLIKSGIAEGKMKGIVSGNTGHHTFFVQLSRGQMTWWQPLNYEVCAPQSKQTTDFSEVVSTACETVNIDAYFNDSVTGIFKNKYLSPRSPYTTLELPTQGIGEWCHPTMTAEIDDSGLRRMVRNNLILTKPGVSFRTPGVGKNIAFTSRWDNFPKNIEIPVSGYSSHAYLLMAGTTNHMQTHFVNGLVVAEYVDGKRDTLELINPENWCPIEQDYFEDGLAFKLKAPRPYRLHLKTGLVSNNLEKELTITGVYGRKIDGGAGILLDMPLDKTKKLRKLHIETVANDVIIGLMSLTLQR